MSKKLPGRTASETNKRWYFNFEKKNWNQQSYVKLWPDEFNSALAAAIAKPGVTYWDVRSKMEIENKNWLAKANPKMKGDLLDWLGTHMNVYLDGGEYKLFSAMCLNAFLFQEDIEVYRDFLEVNSEEIYQQMLSMKFTVYSHTFTVLESLRNSDHILQLRPSASQELKDSVELLTRNQIIQLLGQHISLLQTQPGNVPKVIKAITDLINGKTEWLPPVEQIYNSFFLAFSKSLSNETVSAGYRFDKLSTLVVVHLSGLMKDVYTRTEHSKIGQMSSAEALNLSKYFLSIAEELSPREMFAVVAGIGNPGLFSRGTRQAAREFIIKATEMPREDSIQLFRGLAEIISTYDDGLPTSLQWLRALETDELLFDSGTLMAVILAGGVEKKALTESQRRFRNELNLYCST